MTRVSIAPSLGPGRPSYAYVHIGRRYFCLKQNALALAWHLYVTPFPLGLRHYGQGRRARRLFRALNIAKRLLLCALGPPRDAEQMELPVFGHVCLKTRSGYKVFNLKRSTATRIFNPEVAPEEARQEIANSRLAAEYGFGPPLLGWDEAGRWYEEALVRGYEVRRMDAATRARLLESDLLPMLESLMLAEPPQRVDVLEYVQRRRASKVGQGWELPRNPSSAALDSILQFMDSVTERLRAMPREHVLLVLSHGDGHWGNVVYTGERLVLIDWTEMDRRSLLYDFFSAFFLTLVWGGDNLSDPRQVSRDIDRALASLKAHLENGAPALAREVPRSSQAAEMYRLVFYIEKLCRTPQRLHQMDATKIAQRMRFVEAARRYEAAVAGV